jgi:hypothetical protein
VTEQTGPSMSTESGWMAVARDALATWGGTGAGRNYPSMLLSFERPAPAGVRVDASQRRDRSARGRLA